MTALRAALVDYLDLRRSLGFSLVRDGKLLAQFIGYLEQHGKHTVTVADALGWATLPGGGPKWLGMRMSVVRGFATYLHTLDPASEVPPAGLLPGGSHRAVPYLYRDEGIAALLVQAQRLRTRLPLLSTYLGHTDPANTYWYLHAAPELLAEAARRLDPEGGRR
jgi:hypothetical protein